VATQGTKILLLLLLLLMMMMMMMMVMMMVMMMMMITMMMMIIIIIIVVVVVVIVIMILGSRIDLNPLSVVADSFQKDSNITPLNSLNSTNFLNNFEKLKLFLRSGHNAVLAL